MTTLISVLIFGFGAIIGSFLNVLILRLPEEEAVSGRSHCMDCKHVLSSWELIPVFSYLLLGGKCSHCKSRISPRYFIIESIVGLLFVSTYLILGQNLSTGADYLWFVRALFIVSVMVVVFMIDLEHYLILDNVVFPAAIVVLIFNLIYDFSQEVSIFGSVTWLGIVSSLCLTLFFGSLYVFSKGRWIGFGDVKLAILLGFCLPFPLIISSVFLSFFLGSIVGVILILVGGRTLGSKVPFGTFLALATVVSLWWGKPIMDWYLKIVGLQ